MAQELDAYIAWGKRHNLPLFLGESDRFGDGWHTGVVFNLGPGEIVVLLLLVLVLGRKPSGTRPVRQRVSALTAHAWWPLGDWVLLATALVLGGVAVTLTLRP